MAANESAGGNTIAVFERLMAATMDACCHYYGDELVSLAVIRGRTTN